MGSVEAPLYLFYGSSVLLVSLYGGVFTVMPPYIAEIYGVSQEERIFFPLFFFFIFHTTTSTNLTILCFALFLCGYSCATWEPFMAAF